MSVTAAPTSGRSGRFTWRLTLLLPLVLIVLALEERLTRAPFTGAHNSTVLVVLVAALATLLVLRGGVRLFRFGDVIVALAVMLVIVATTVGRGDLREAARYLLTALAALGWTVLLRSALASPRFRRNVMWALRGMVLLGAVLSVPTLQSAARSTGFLVSSPTLFAYLLLVALCAFLWGARSRWDLLFAAIAAVLILDTGARTSIVALGLLIVLRLLGSFEARRRDNRLSLAGVRIVLVAAILAAPLLAAAWYGRDAASLAVSSFDQLSQRSAAADSTATRLAFYGTILREFDPVTSVVGSGAGSAFALLTEATGRRIPPHFDLLALAADFGAGFVLLAVAASAAVFVRYGPAGGPSAVLLAYLLSGQFHNAMYSPLAVLVSVTCFWYLASVGSGQDRSPPAPEPH